jgi:Amt family ammonium transporter
LTLSNVEYTGVVAAQAAITTTLATAAGAVAAMFLHLWLDERRTGEAHFNVITTMNGALAGIVAITGGCTVLEPWASVLVGAVAGIIYLGSSNMLIRLRIDDAVDAVPVHLFPGMWGLFSIGLFANPSLRLACYGTREHAGLFYELANGHANFTLLACQIMCILFILGWVFFMIFPFFIWLNYMGWLRSDSLEELVGLDISYHGGSAVNTEHVRSEYLEAYNRQKVSIRKKRGSSRQYDDSPTSQEDAAEEAIDFDNVDMG